MMRYERLPDIPVVQPSQYIVTHAEVRTGYVLTITGERYTGQGERYLVFDSLADAEYYAEATVIHDPFIECWIADYEGKGIKRIEGNLDIVVNAIKTPSKKKRWWFWSR